MTNSPKISIIIPVYNAERYLDRCLKSILSQTLKDLEVIIVNDGSKDESLDVINKYIKMDKRVILINQKNCGAAISRQNAIPLAKADFIAFVDSDDYIEETMYESMYSEAIKYNADIVTCQFRKINSNNETDYITTPDKESLENILKGKVYSVLWNKLYKKELFIENNIIINKDIFYEDVGMVYKLYYFANKVHTVPNIFYNWNKMEGSITESFTKKHIKSMFYILKDMNSFMIKYKPCNFDFFINKYFFSINFLFNRVLLFSKNIKEAKKLYHLIIKNLKMDSKRFKKNLLLLKNIDIILYHKIMFHLSLKKFFIKITPKKIKNLSKTLTIPTKNKEINLLKEIVLIKKDIYKNKYPELLKIEFSKQINFLYKEIYQLKIKNEKIAIYGNGLIGNIIAKELEKNLIIIFDKNINLKSSYSKIDTPDNINKYTFDILVISVLGREESIIKEIKKMKANSKINFFSFKLSYLI